MAKVKALVAGHASVMKLDVLARTNGNYSADVEVVTVDLGGVNESPSGKLRLLLDFGEHAREFITSEVGLKLLQALADEAALKQLLLDSGYWSLTQIQELVGLLRCCVAFKILPMENRKGRDAVDRGDLCERKNGERVDPNRNWGVDWGVKEKDYDPYEENPGAHPFSEPEAMAVRDVAQEFRPHVWINVHSGMSGLFMPYDHIAQVATGRANDYTLSMLKAINQVAFKGRCVVGSGGSSVGYLAHGTATDYMMDVLHVAAPMTWEIFGDLKAHYSDCFRMFNPLTRADFDETLQQWTTAIFDTLVLMVDHPAESVAALGLGGADGRAGGGTQQPPALRLALSANGGGGLGRTTAGVATLSQPGQPAAHGVAVVAVAQHGGSWLTRPWDARAHSYESRQLIRAAGAIAVSAVFAIAWALLRRWLGPGRRKRRLLSLSTNRSQ